MLLSLTVLCSVLDNVPTEERMEKEKYAIATASVSLILSFIVVVGHMLTSLRYYLVGTVLELFCAIIPLSLWIVGTVFIQNPYNSFASNVDEDLGNEEIEFANLFFFSWIVLFSNTYLVGSIFRDYGSYDPQISGWLILFMSSIVLMGMGATLRTDLCDKNDVILCRRNDFGIAIGSIFSSRLRTVLLYPSVLCTFQPGLGQLYHRFFLSVEFKNFLKPLQLRKRRRQSNDHLINMGMMISKASRIGLETGILNRGASQSSIL